MHFHFCVLSFISSKQWVRIAHKPILLFLFFSNQNFPHFPKHNSHIKNAQRDQLRVFRQSAWFHSEQTSRRCDGALNCRVPQHVPRCHVKGHRERQPSIVTKWQKSCHFIES
jgi:hypothetical protein